jgi:hypothetical protein
MMRSEQLATKPGQFSENQVIFARIFIEHGARKGPRAEDSQLTAPTVAFDWNGLTSCGQHLVCFWPKADIPIVPANVRFWG